jgi:aspartokinase
MGRKMGKDLCHGCAKTDKVDVNMSNSERSTGDVVKEFIERDGVIKNGLARELINARALARHIQVATHERYSFEAILSAIRRYPVKASATKHRDLGKMISKLTLKNKIAVVSIRNSPEIPSLLAKFSGEIDYGRGETLRILSGPESVTVVIDSKNLAKLTEKTPKKDIAKTFEELSEIVVTLSELAATTPGVLAALATELAINGVNLITSAAPPNTHVFVVEEKEALSGYRALERLSRG